MIEIFEIKPKTVNYDHLTTGDIEAIYFDGEQILIVKLSQPSILVTSETEKVVSFLMEDGYDVEHLTGSVLEKLDTIDEP